MSHRRAYAACLIAAIAASLAAIGLAQTLSTPGSALDWRQRYLGILPLVKANASDPVVATVNGTNITLAEVDSYARTEGHLINANTSAETQAVWRDALENLIGRTLLVQEAARRGIKLKDAEVAQRAREYQLASGSGDTIAQTGAPDELLTNEVRGSMEIERMLDKEFETHRVRPTDEQIQKYYDEHKDLFVKDPGEVRLSHIAVKLPPDATDKQKDEALAKIKKLHQQALKTKDFAKLARENSEDPNSAPQGGDLGYFSPGRLPPVVEKIAFAAKAGGISEIIASNIGYSFLKVTERRGTTYAPLKEVRPKVALVLLGYNQEDVVQNLLKELRKKAKIEFRQMSKPPTT